MSSALERLLRYVRIDTQSDPHSTASPTTEKQKDLGRLLVTELHALGLRDAELDAYGYVYATLPATTDQNVPVICWCAHMDTSPEAPGADVQPIVHRNYDGGLIHLPFEGIVLDPAEHPDLRDQVGSAIVTADGRTLLGADNKAGIAEIMAAVEWLVAHPNVAHGTIKILFTPDEEVGRGTAHVDLQRLGAEFAYTVDGERRGTLEDETFSADGAILTFMGANTHPGFAKGKMVNALKGAGALLARIEHEWSPEGTDGTDGFVHPYEVKGGVESAQIEFILRSFRTADLAGYADRLRALASEVCIQRPGLSFSLEVREQYRSMKEVLDRHPEVANYAEEAMRRAGLTPERGRIRGGTDGSQLSFMGLPTVNIFAGEHAFHSRYEWVSEADMEYAVQTLIELAQVWAEARR
ncbi:MAG: peptidase [Bacteroidota bacterium]|jgi:tripeptide aminopeptidase